MHLEGFDNEALDLHLNCGPVLQQVSGTGPIRGHWSRCELASVVENGLSWDPGARVEARKSTEFPLSDEPSCKLGEAADITFHSANQLQIEV